MNFLTKKPGAASAASVVNKVGFWPAKDSLFQLARPVGDRMLRKGQTCLTRSPTPTLAQRQFRFEAGQTAKELAKALLCPLPGYFRKQVPLPTHKRATLF